MSPVPWILGNAMKIAEVPSLHLPKQFNPLKGPLSLDQPWVSIPKLESWGGYPHLWMQPNHKSGLMVCKSLKRLQPPINTKTTLDVSNKSVGRFEILLGDFNPC